jgi:cyclohexyl-isocyanide hydratase
MSHYGAGLADARVVVDGNIVSAAGVTAGLDAALVLVSLLRGDAAAQEIQLAIEYAPDLSFIAELRTLRHLRCSKASCESTNP